MADSITVQLKNILDEYMTEVDQTVEKDTAQAARDTAKDLRGSSPSKTGEYSSGWASKKIDAKTAVTYNRKMPGLTHLLENGHVIKNKKGEFGRVAARKHIAPAAERNEIKFEQNIERDLS